MSLNFSVAPKFLSVTLDGWKQHDLMKNNDKYTKQTMNNKQEIYNKTRVYVVFILCW